MGITTPERGMFKEPNSVFGKTILLVIIILFSTRLLTRTTFVTYYLIFEAFWYLFIAAFTIVYAMYIFLVKQRVDEIHLYFALIFILPIQSGICANLSEHYPILSGIIAQRHWYGIGGIFLIVVLLQNGFYTLKDLYRAFEWLGWVCLVWFTLCYIFLDPTHYLDYAFVGYSDIKGGYRFKFGVDFIAFLSVYYTIKYMQEKKGRMILFAAIHLSYLFFLHQGRTVMIAVMGAIAMYYMFEVNWKRALRFFVSAGISVMFAGLILYLIIPDRVNDYITQYVDVFSILSGQETGESSADARLEETAILFVYMQNYPQGWIYGIGKLASSESTAGSGVHDISTVPPGDIGFLGSLMTYGVIGTIIIYLQFLIAFRSLKFIRRFKNDTYIITAKYFLLYCFLTSLAKGYLFMQPGSTAIFILVIYAFKLYEVKLDKAGIDDTPRPVLAEA